MSCGADESAARQRYAFEVAYAPQEIGDVVRVGHTGKAREYRGCIVEFPRTAKASSSAQNPLRLESTVSNR